MIYGTVMLKKKTRTSSILSFLRGKTEQYKPMISIKRGSMAKLPDDALLPQLLFSFQT